MTGTYGKDDQAVQEKIESLDSRNNSATCNTEQSQMGGVNDCCKMKVDKNIYFPWLEGIFRIRDVLTKVLSIQMLGDIAPIDHRDTGSFID